MIRTTLAALTALALLSLPARAAETLDTLGCPREPVRIVVLGDSLADGLWGSFYRAFAGCQSMEVVRGTAVSDGLAKSAPDDWLSRLGPEATAQADMVVVQMGANDITNIREGTKRLVFGSDDWRNAYAARAGALVDGLSAIAPKVVWLGLPIVGQARYEDSYREISTLQEQAALARGAVFVDTHTPTTFGADNFVMSAEIQGSVRQLRASDQVHFTEIGYDLVAGLLSRDVAALFRTRARTAAMDGMTLQ